MPVTLGATIAPLTGIAEPFFSVGAGLNTLVGGTLGTDVDFLFEAALGVLVERLQSIVREEAVWLLLSGFAICEQKPIPRITVEWATEGFLRCLQESLAVFGRTGLRSSTTKRSLTALSAALAASSASK